MATRPAATTTADPDPATMNVLANMQRVNLFLSVSLQTLQTSEVPFDSNSVFQHLFEVKCRLS